ncbi:MAG: twin-arginine translocation signal domain-containing protein [Betaproteobacteria bacterium]|nr:twin-arginine translocation signal domain-containing protein [Betaproteobacteria bacterium]
MTKPPRQFSPQRKAHVGQVNRRSFLTTAAAAVTGLAGVSGMSNLLSAQRRG